MTTLSPKRQEKTLENPHRLGSLSWLVGKQVPTAKGMIDTPQIDSSDSSHLRVEAAEEKKTAREEGESESVPQEGGEQQVEMSSAPLPKETGGMKSHYQNMHSLLDNFFADSSDEQ